MNCLDRIALTEYLRGKLSPEDLLAASEHIFACDRCRQKLKSLESYAPAAAYVRDAAFGVTECPEYEELSAYVDGTLAAARLTSVESHLSQCHFCSSDVDTMRSMRARAELATPIIAKPVKFKRGFSWSFLPVWQKVAAGAAVAALIAGGALSLRHPSQMVAVNPGKDRPAGIHMPTQPPKPAVETPTATRPEPEKVAVNPGTERESTSTGTSGRTARREPPLPATRLNPTRAPRPRPVEERIDLASLGVDASLEAKLEQAVEQKRQTGAVKVDEPVRVALATTYGVRDTNYHASPLAPTPVYPSRGVYRNSPEVLRWNPVDLAVNYRVTVRDKAGRTIVRETVEGTDITLSDPLPRDRNYMWQVESYFGPGSDWVKAKAVAFRVISAQENEAVERAESKFANRPDVLGAVYESMGLYKDAVKQFERYRAAHPSALSSKMLEEARQKQTSLE